MKRSEINAIMRSADEFIRRHGFLLPPFAYWTPADWASSGPEVSEVVENNLGWDITDFGQGDFEHFGLFLFTVRNGHPDNLKTLKGKLYAEKIMVVREGQMTPFHFHWKKTEDIINRGGGRLLIQLYNADEEEELDQTGEVRVSKDGVWLTCAPGGIVSLEPGESITLTPYLYHQFWGEGAPVLVGEVSSVNDDNQDNRFLLKIGRFPEIDEDEPPVYLLCNDYSRYYRPESAGA